MLSTCLSPTETLQASTRQKVGLVFVLIRHLKRFQLRLIFLALCLPIDLTFHLLVWLCDICAALLLLVVLFWRVCFHYFPVRMRNAAFLFSRQGTKPRAIFKW